MTTRQRIRRRIAVTALALFAALGLTAGAATAASAAPAHPSVFYHA